MSEYIHDELIAANHALLQRVNELEQKNKKLENDYKNAMETVGRMAVRIADLEQGPVQGYVSPVRSQGLISPVRSQGLPWPEDTPEEERVNLFADKVRQLDEIRKKKREEEKRPRHGPLPKPLLSRSRRLTMDDLSTDRSTDHVLFEEPILYDQRDGLMEGLGRHLENIRRERSSSLADADLLAKKRFPR